MENEGLDKLLHILQRKRKFKFSLQNIHILKVTARTTTLSTALPLNSIGLRFRKRQRTYHNYAQTIWISRRSNFVKFLKKRCTDKIIIVIPKGTVQGNDNSTNQPPESFPANSGRHDTNTIPPNRACSRSTNTYQSRYYGTPVISSFPLSYGYTHLSPETQVDALIPSIVHNSYTKTSLPYTRSRNPPFNTDTPPYQEATSSTCKKTKSLNPLPRHKRESHINAEYRRRNKIQMGFDTLKNIIPSLTENQSVVSQKESKSTMLFAAVEFSKELKAVCEENEREEQRLKQQIIELERDIQRCQKGLPICGVDGVNNLDPQIGLDNMLQEYLGHKMSENWKFWIFSVLVRSLFSSFIKGINSSSYPAFIKSVRNWSEESLQLNRLRLDVIALLKYISTNTSIMSTPDQLPRDAYLDYQKWRK